MKFNKLKYNVSQQPYSKVAFEEIKKQDSFIEENNKLAVVNDKLIYNLAKSTGLKSKKRRFIKKRFKKVFKQIILTYLNNQKGESYE